ncbi:MAG: hypothetical protein ABIQ12_08915 [Opitutaceae bacterium]
MKSRLLVLALVLVAGVAIYFGVAQPHVSKLPQRVREQVPDLKPVMPALPELPPLAMPAMPVLSPPVLPSIERKP